MHACSMNCAQVCSTSKKYGLASGHPSSFVLISIQITALMLNEDQRDTATMYVIISAAPTSLATDKRNLSIHVGQTRVYCSVLTIGAD